MSPRPPATSRSSSTVIAVLACVAVLAALYFAKEVLITFALAILFTFILAPLVNVLERWKLGRVLPVILVVCLAFIVIAAISAVVFFQITDLAGQIPQYADNIKQKVKDVTPGRDSIFSKFTRAAEQVNQSIEQAAEEVAAEEAATAPAGVGSPPQTLPETQPVPVTVTTDDDSAMAMMHTAQPAIDFMTTGAVVTVLVIFMLLERRSLRDRVIVIAGQQRLNLTTVALEEAGRRISRYLGMQLLVNFLYGLPVGIGLWLIGVPNAFLWGLIAMLVRFIPYVGPWIGAMFPIALSLAVFDSWLKPSMVIGLFVVLELIVNNVLEPRLYGAEAGVSPLALLAATVFWTWLWGPVGLLLAVPMTVCVVVIARFAPHLSFLNALLTDQPQLAEDARFHQRLLSLDFDEAFEIAESNCREHSLIDTYDRIVLPALRQVEKDRHNEMIDAERATAIHNGLNLLIIELNECTNLEPVKELPSAGPQPAVLCIAARAVGDELAARMLVQVLLERGTQAETLPAGALASEVIEAIEQKHPNVLCISAMPPSAIGQARHLSLRIHEHLAHLPLVVGIWDVNHRDRMQRRLAASDELTVVTTLADAVKAITNHESTTVNASNNGDARPTLAQSAS